ncbi:MAG: MFS transporter [Actinomycetota bacterium]|nr:MFS transporter [Actinomycetota bacterium]
MSTATPSTRTLRATLTLLATMMSIIGSLGAPLIGTVAQANRIPLSTAEWILTATLLTGALATPVMGRLADGHLQRKVVLVALGIVLVGLVMSALSSDFTWLLVGRSLQGLGMGLLPVTMTIARSHLAPPVAARTIASLSVTAAIGVGLGYPVTSVIAQYFDYHSAFWFAAVLIGATLVLAAKVLPDTTARAHRDFDLVGAVILTLSLVGLLSLLGEGQVWGWTSPHSLSLGAGGAVLLLVWCLYELRRHDPLVNLRQSKHRAVITADASGFLISVSMYLFMPVVVEYVQVPRSTGFGFGSSIFTSGLLLVPLSIGTFTASRFVPLLVRHFNARVTVPLGALLFAVAAVTFAHDHRSLWEAFVAMGIAGLGGGLTFAAMPGYIVRATPEADTGAALGFYQLLRSIGLSIGSAAAGAILAHFTVAGATLPAQAGFLTALDIAAGLLVFTAVLSYVLLGDTPAGNSSSSTVELMEEGAELGASGLGLPGE